MSKESDLRRLDNFVIFRAGESKVNIDVYFKDDTLWLS